MATAVGKRATGEADISDQGVGSPDEKKLKKVDGSSSSESESEWDKFDRQISESNGFDVDANPYFLDDGYCCYFVAFNDPNEVPERAEACTELAIEAIQYHNLNKKPENANLEFVKLVKFCHEYTKFPYEIYYITFDAKDVIHGSVQTCQAKVLLDCKRGNTWSKFNFTPKVLMFRKKGDMDFIGLVIVEDAICDRSLSSSIKTF